MRTKINLLSKHNLNLPCYLFFTSYWKEAKTFDDFYQESILTIGLQIQMYIDSKTIKPFR